MIPISPEINTKGFRFMAVGLAGMWFFVGFLAHSVLAIFEEKPPVFTAAMCPKPAVVEPVAPVACEPPPHPKSQWDVGAKVKYINTDGIIPLNSEGVIVRGLSGCEASEEGERTVIGFSIDFDIAEETLCIGAKDLRPF